MAPVLIDQNMVHGIIYSRWTVQDVLDITANNLCRQPNSPLQQDLVNKIIKIKAAAMFPFSLIRIRCQCVCYFWLCNLSHWVNIASMTRPIGLFEIPFLWSCALFIEQINLPRYAICSGWLTQCLDYDFSSEKHAYQILITDQAVLNIRRRGQIWRKRIALQFGNYSTLIHF